MASASPLSFGRDSRRVSDLVSTNRVSKRVFDIVCVLLAAPLVLPIGLFVACALLIIEGRPVFFIAPRVGQGLRPFGAFKFRTMQPLMGPSDHGVTGGNKNARISRFCGWLRRRRIDELPQLINVLKGEMSLVGPRPPDAHYVQLFPELYAQVLTCRPGVTGLATLHMHRFEDRFLQRFETADATEDAYCRICIPRKARLDLLYKKRLQKSGAIAFDMYLIYMSLKAVCPNLAKRHR